MISPCLKCNQSMILIDATYIHESGGKTLLEYFITSLINIGKPFHLLLDNRFESNCLSHLSANQYEHINSSESDRAKYYKKNKDRIYRVFCFANVPPPEVNSQVKVFILFHNSLILVDFFERNGYSVKEKILFLIRRFYIRFRSDQRYIWIVQTLSMKSKLYHALGVPNSSIYVMPFFNIQKLDQRLRSDSEYPQFLYVADGVKQKNHDVLLDAWEILYNTYNLPIPLHLTIPERFFPLRNRIQQLAKRGLKITNHGLCDKAKLYGLYQNCTFLVFPSLTESFGLPLLEATYAGCNVIASNLSYVYDVISPTDTFDPCSARDIASVIVKSLQSNRQTKVVVQDHIFELINLLYQN